MPKFYVSKSIVINAPTARVYENIRNLTHWKEWSPWLILEPGAEVTISDDRHSYSWKGSRLGSGNMTVTNEKEHEWIEYDLRFLTPFRSQADIRFELTSKGQQTEVTWLMNSSLPWFLFFMTKSMAAFLGMDFQRGLYLLKDLSEDGTVHCQLDFIGTTTYPGCRYIGIHTTCALSELDTKMAENFGRLEQMLADRQVTPAGEPVAIYHHWDVVNGKARYTAGMPVDDVPAELPAGFISGVHPQTAVYTLRHTGPYRHLGNAWGALNSMQRNKEFTANKKVDPFETYSNDPATVPENELITEVHFPVK